RGSRGPWSRRRAVPGPGRRATGGGAPAGRAGRTGGGRAGGRVGAGARAGAPVTGLAFSAVLAHPADKRADHSIKLTELGAGLYAGEAADVPAGQWDLALSAARGPERQFLSKSRVILK